MRNRVKKIIKRVYSDNQRKDIRRLLGNNLREARKNAGYTQTQVMQMLWGCGKNRNRISEIENGHIEIDIYQLLLLIDLYGQSSDYILGRSCEPINDILAAHINNVKLNTKKYLEPLIEAMTEKAVSHIKRIGNSEYLELLSICDELGHYFIANSVKLKEKEPNLHRQLYKLSHAIRKIRIGEARREQQMYAQIEAIKERHDKNDGHMLLADLEYPRQCTIPFPEPIEQVVEIEVENG